MVDGEVYVLVHMFTTFMKDMYGSYALMFVIFLLAMRVTVILFNVLTGNGLHLGGYIGSVDSNGRDNRVGKDGHTPYGRWVRKHGRLNGSGWSWHD